jgi:hypothetical protein
VISAAFHTVEPISVSTTYLQRGIRRTPAASAMRLRTPGMQKDDSDGISGDIVSAIISSTRPS